ncbi:hypothetical protein AgCh_039509 [Apium graveolens]
MQIIKKQNSVSTSTVEAEYIAAGSCCAQILWMKNQLLDYGLHVDKISIFCDNTSAITENPVQHSRTKHIDIKYRFIREHVINGTVELHFVPMSSNLQTSLPSHLMSPPSLGFASYQILTLASGFASGQILTPKSGFAKVIYCDVVKQIWTTAVYNSKDKTIAFSLKGYKLGDIKKRSKNIYYARFFMMLANFVFEDLVIENPNNKLDCWVQEKRVLAYLSRNNLNNALPLNYLPIFEAQQMPTQATKPKSKSKSKKPTSVVSQKTAVVTTTTSLEGSAQDSQLGEVKGEHQRCTKDKEGEVCVTQTSRTAVSQQTVVINKEISSLLVASSQKDVTIEMSSQPRAHAKRGQTQTYIRKKKSKPLRESEGTHKVPTEVKDSVNTPSQIQTNVSPTNVESQPKSLIIKTPHTQNSPTIFLDVDMIHTSIPDSPSLLLMEEPKSKTPEHHLIDDLLA